MPQCEAETAKLSQECLCVWVTGRTVYFSWKQPSVTDKVEPTLCFVLYKVDLFVGVHIWYLLIFLTQLLVCLQSILVLMICNKRFVDSYKPVFILVLEKDAAWARSSETKVRYDWCVCVFQGTLPLTWAVPWTSSWDISPHWKPMPPRPSSR